MKIGRWETHPAADMFPMHDETHLAALGRSILAMGQRVPIELFEEKILDGRNRLAACLAVGVAPVFVDAGTCNPYDRVWALNSERRHLEPFQRAALAVQFSSASGEWNRARDAAKEEANRKRAASAKQQHVVSNPRVGERVSGRASAEAAPKHVAEVTPRKAAETIATQANVSRATVERALELQRKAPEKFEQVARGELEGRKALDEVKREKKQALADQIRREPAPPVSGPFRVISTDPPWPYETREEDASHRGRTDYPLMSTIEICALPVQALAHPEGCILFLWTTNAFMRQAYKCLDAWGFEEKTILTWDKEQLGLGNWLRNVTEHAVVAIRGRPLVTLTNQTTLIRELRREHSAKPEKFYEMVESLCPGSKLEMFSRRDRPGWASWGAETGKLGSVAGGAR